MGVIRDAPVRTRGFPRNQPQPLWLWFELALRDALASEGIQKKIRLAACIDIYVLYARICLHWFLELPRRSCIVYIYVRSVAWRFFVTEHIDIANTTYIQPTRVNIISRLRAWLVEFAYKLFVGGDGCDLHYSDTPIGNLSHGVFFCATCLAHSYFFFRGFSYKVNLLLHHRNMNMIMILLCFSHVINSVYSYIIMYIWMFSRLIPAPRRSE